MLRAATAAHTNLATANEAWAADRRIRVHSGGHVGPVVVDELGDVFGDAVNVAARVQGIAGPDQIFVTRDVIEGIGPDDPPFESRRIGAFPLRGKNEDVELHEVMWRTESSTMLVSHAVLRELAAAAKLRLRSFGRTVDFPADRDRITIGRIEGNDLVVADAAVSREHADIVRRKGFFYLVDRSTNGTYARPGSAMPRHVHRDEFLLEGTGSFSLGRPDGPPVEYEVG
jgi:adenylate cyclase